jgi:hypothetical protein
MTAAPPAAGPPAEAAGDAAEALAAGDAAETLGAGGAVAAPLHAAAKPATTMMAPAIRVLELIGHLVHIVHVGSGRAVAFLLCPCYVDTGTFGFRDVEPAEARAAKET